MLAPLLVFLVVTGLVFGGYLAVTYLPGEMSARALARRLQEVSSRDPVAADQSFLRQRRTGPLPAIDELLGRGGSPLMRLIEQSGVETTPSAVVVASLVAGLGAGFATALFLRLPVAWLLAGVAGSSLPTLWLVRKRAVRLRRFEEQFPEALDLLSRAIRAGHAFQAAMGMVADELPPPVGVEFRKSFDQQNFGLPLKEALHELAERVPILDVKFFVTAVLIQRETGGNLAEILDNLAHVVRERFKILRQVRVHTAHGRFTGYVLLALPAALAIALAFINPEHMDLLFRERMGQMMILGAIVMQTIGFIWIRQVIKIEV